MKASRYAALLALALAPSACEREVSGFLSCGQEVCGPRQECVAVDQGVACACLEGYLGEDCDICAFGYKRTLDRGCELILIDCNDNPEVCGDHGQCTSDAEGDYCSCGAVYEGRLCESCVDGYQDNDLDGSCEPSCISAELECELPTRCSDATGTPECVCPTGYVGEQCDQCALGYRNSDGDCVLTCEASDLTCGPREVCDDSGSSPRCVCEEGYSGTGCNGCASGYLRDESTGVCLPGCELEAIECGDHGQCSESLGFAACQCDLGYAGELCDRCALGYELAADACVFTPPATHTLLADAAVFGQSQLVAIDPASGDAIAVGEQQFAGLAGGLLPGTAYAFVDEGVSLLDLPSGTHSVVVSQAAGQPVLAFDATRELLYGVGSGWPHPLLWIDPAAGSAAPQGATGLPGVRDLTYDAVDDRVLALAEGLVAIDPSTTEVTTLADPPPATRGIAFAPDGTLYALAATDLTAEEARIDACRKTAAGLGLLGYDAAPGSVIEPAPEDATFALDSVQTAEPEVIAYLGRLSLGERSVSVISDNPDAVLCLEVQEPTLVDIPEAATFRALVVYTVNQAVEIDVDPDFAAGATPTIHLGAIVPEFSFTTVGVVREYSPEEWLELRLPIDPRFYAPGPGVLHVLDSTLASTSTVTLPEDVRPFGTLTAWSPAP